MSSRGQVSDSLLLRLCDELLLQIFAFLDIPDCLHASRTCRRLRYIATDPILHHHRILSTSDALLPLLVRRPPLSVLLASRIYIPPQAFAARSLARSLTAIALNRKLARRPSVKALVDSGILPSQCGRGTVAWGLISVQRRIEREVVKDRLKTLLTRSWRQEVERRGKGSGESVEHRVSVGHLVERFAGITRVGAPKMRISRPGEPRPSRAHVSRLRRFWETKLAQQ